MKQMDSCLDLGPVPTHLITYMQIFLNPKSPKLEILLLNLLDKSYSTCSWSGAAVWQVSQSCLSPKNFLCLLVTHSSACCLILSSVILHGCMNSSNYLENWLLSHFGAHVECILCLPYLSGKCVSNKPLVSLGKIACSFFKCESHCCRPVIQLLEDGLVFLFLHHLPVGPEAC